MMMMMIMMRVVMANEMSCSSAAGEYANFGAQIMAIGIGNLR